MPKPPSSRAKRKPRKPAPMMVNGFTAAWIASEGMVSLWGASLARTENMRRLASWLLRAADWLDATAQPSRPRPGGGRE